LALTKFDVVSRAARELGAEAVQSFDEDTAEAGTFGLIYDGIYDEVLSLGHWPFALKTFELSRIVDAPVDPNFKYQFQLPTDCLAPHEGMDHTGTPCDYVIDGTVVLSNCDRVLLKYTHRPPYTDLPPYFVDLLVFRLAYRAAESIVGIGSVKERLESDYEGALARAKLIAAQSNPPRKWSKPGRLRASRAAGTFG